MMQTQRELSSFPIAPVHKTKLAAAGFIIVEDLKGMKPSELSKETGIGMEESLDILKLVLGTDGKGDNSGHVDKSALDILKQEQSLPHIVTFSEQLDNMLGGGVPLCKITEFCGAPGTGKTQICMQLAVDAQIPECLGGLEAEVIYIDTEGSFIVERLVDIVTATVEHCKEIAGGDQDSGELGDFTPERVLSRMHYYRCHDYIELLATIHLLPDFIKQHSKVRLVIVDSVAFHFRHDFDDMSLRTRLLTSTAQNLIKLATTFELAVVLTNQMTTKVRAGESSQLVPALGESWGHASTIRVILYWEGQERYAWLYKSPSHREARVPYQVTMGGIRDVVTEDESHNDDTVDTDKNPTKRQRVT
ncbi:DNA repair protein RAD51 homolog 3-like [Mizuhopecten yessoensis]|nr:DNA repair protein RAD51 homolog 3-like [Mizuhopecten yessoensis]XP_021370415.1 DNA repair protein RAD51 homolog 3-like [Mizuhopecten yessoensis]XP_021370416.1 DNA repair protein RAD51 homolog 3-like [Mizuhopecten yessoensis]